MVIPLSEEINIKMGHIFQSSDYLSLEHTTNIYHAFILRVSFNSREHLRILRAPFSHNLPLWKITLPSYTGKYGKFYPFYHRLVTTKGPLFAHGPEIPLRKDKEGTSQATAILNILNSGSINCWLVREKIYKKRKLIISWKELT